MKRLAVFTGMILLACVPFGSGAPVGGRNLKLDQLVGAYAAQTYSQRFKGGEKASVIATGTTGKTFMGLYIFDADGNCIAWDDLGNKKTCDDMAAEWVPPATANYTIEVRNFGPYPNWLNMAFR